MRGALPLHAAPTDADAPADADLSYAEPRTSEVAAIRRRRKGASGPAHTGGGRCEVENAIWLRVFCPPTGA